jgi:Spy/CpxP family protein refolding chaperone
MTPRFTLKWIAASACLIGAGSTFGQHVQAPAHPASPYAGQQTREIKALSAEQTADLLAGKGMEQAKAAELNGYLGPMHVLELARPLELSAEQKQASEMLMRRHKAEARDLGAQLVEAERALELAFASRQIDAAGLAAHTDRLGRLQGQLRRSHLETHLLQTALLRPEQISRYAQLRAYTGAGATAAPAAGHLHKH